jgi:predicted acetyltransferase
LPKIDLVPASPDQQPILANLLELYIHDFSEFVTIPLSPDGAFGYPDLPLYWTTPGHHPFLLKVDGNWAGFVLVKQDATPSGQLTFDIAEFFVMRGYRRRGIGIEVAHQILHRFPGPWTVRVMQLNQAALPFWEHTITAFTGHAVEPSIIERNDHFLLLYSFISPPPPTR